VLATLAQIGADGLDTNGNRAVVDATFVHALRARGLEFHVWTIDDVGDARYFQRLGADSITTNRPALLRDELARISDMHDVTAPMGGPTAARRSGFGSSTAAPAGQLEDPLTEAQTSGPGQ
jgi:hypothetical protein